MRVFLRTSSARARSERLLPLGPVDVLPAACGHSWQELSRFIEGMVIDDVPIRIFSLEGLLLTKEGARDRDKADATVLRAAVEKLSGKK